MDEQEPSYAPGASTRRNFLRAVALSAAALSVHRQRSPASATVAPAPVAPPPTGQVLGVAVGEPALVAVGVDDDDGPAIWVSADGAEWQELPLDGRDFGQAELSGVTWHAGRYIAVGTLLVAEEPPAARPGPHLRRVPAVWESPDGHHWEVRRLDAAVAARNARLAAVEGRHDRVVAVGCLLDSDAAEAIGGLVLVRRDGGDWFLATAPADMATEGGLTGVAPVDDTWLAVGSNPDGAMAWFSDDAETWTRHGAVLQALDGVGLHDVLADADGVRISGSVLGEQRVRQFHSPDGGATWHERELEVLGSGDPIPTPTPTPIPIPIPIPTPIPVPT